MSASMPCFSKKRRVSSGTRSTPARPAGGPRLVVRRVLRDGEHDPERAARRLRVAQLAEDHDVAGRLLDPVPAGDAEVEEALGDVGGDLLRAQDPHLVDARVVDRGLVVDGRRALDAAGRRPRTARAWASRANPWAGRGAARAARVGAWPWRPGNPILAGGASAGTRRQRRVARREGGDVVGRRLGRLDASSRLAKGLTPSGISVASGTSTELAWRRRPCSPGR